MKVGNIVPYIYSIIPVIRILTFNIGFSEKKISEKSKITASVNLHLGLISYSTVAWYIQLVSKRSYEDGIATTQQRNL